MCTAKNALVAVAILLFCGIAFVPSARADLWNQKVKLTFDQPVEVPGRVLSAGTYWFQLANNESDRDVVEIFGSKDQHLYAIEQTVAAVRPTATNRVEIKFAERRHDNPEALLAWYYPGTFYGHRFVYSSNTEKLLAQDMRQELLVTPKGSTLVRPSGEVAG